MSKLIIVMTLLASSISATAQTVIDLYPGTAPNSVRNSVQEKKDQNEQNQIYYSKVTRPTLEIHLPERATATGAAVVICPGGGYSFVSYTNEGTDIAKAFNKIGVAAFILKYRLPSDETMKDKTVGPLQDAQQAIKTVRLKSSEWHIDPRRVGIVGFSAGGHLASTAGTHYAHAVIPNDEKVSLRPDFMILGYPVISMGDSLTHQGSKDNLLGKNAAPAQEKAFSNDQQVDRNTPPTFLFHCGDDNVVKVQNSLRFYESCLKNGVPAEMHIYPFGGHGFGLNNRKADDRWMDRVENWMHSNGWLAKSQLTESR